MPQEEVQIAVLQTEFKNLTKEVTSLGDKIDEISIKLDDHYVKKTDFEPVQKKVDALWDFRWRILAIAFVGGLVGEFIFQMIIKHTAL